MPQIRVQESNQKWLNMNGFVKYGGILCDKSLGEGTKPEYLLATTLWLTQNYVGITGKATNDTKTHSQESTHREGLLLT